MRSKALCRILCALLFLSVAPSGLNGGDAAGAEAGDFYAHYIFTDARTGESFYEVTLFLNPREFVSAIVFRTADGEWLRLPDGVRQFPGESEAGCVRVNPYWLRPAPFLDACYDAAADELVYTAMFEPSPSGKWGLKTIRFYETADDPLSASDPHPSIPYGSRILAKKGALMLKNYATGEIRLAGITGVHPDYVWLPDGTLALSRYSEADREYELVRIHPATGEAKRLFAGLLRGYNAEQGLLRYVDAKGEWYVHDVRAGKSRPYREAEDAKLFSGSVPPDRPAPLPAPVDFDLTALPVAETVTREKPVAALTLDGREIPLPFAFVGLDGETYVPLRPLVDRGWTLTWEPLAGGGHEFVAESERGGLRLNRANSMALDDRLYVRLGLIRSLGHEAELKWLP